MPNQILAALPEEVLANLVFKKIEIRDGAVLFDSKSPAEHVYFIDEGIVSIGVRLGTNSIATSLIGPEGVVGALESAPNSYAVAVSALKVRRMRLERFHTLLKSSSEMRKALNSYCRKVLVQSQADAACNSLHEVSGRVARLLLRLSAKLNSDDFAITHDGLAALLGVRRSTVTLELTALRELQTVSYSRGQMIIRDKRLLTSAACKCPI